MDFGSALEGLLFGHRLRQKTWPEGNYIYYNDQQFYSHVEGCQDRPLNEFASDQILAHNWEIA